MLEDVLEKMCVFLVLTSMYLMLNFAFSVI